jgi:hypothetical protein
MAIFLAVLAVGLVTVGICTIVRLDGTVVVGGRATGSAASGSKTYAGARARRRAERTASPALFLLASVLTLLVLATLV